MKDDEIEATVCYEDLHGAIVRFVGGEPVHLVETLALGLIQMLFDRYERITRIRITVHKPQAPIRGTFQTLE